MNTLVRHITFLRNPFDPLDREFRTVPAYFTYREIFEDFTCHYTIDYAVIIDTDYIVDPADYDKVPKNEYVYVKIVPSGGNKAGWMTMGLGALAVIAGAILIYTGVGAGVGAMLIGTGVSMLLGGAVLNWGMPEVPGMDSGAMSQQRSSIQGSRNQARKGSRLPFMLGRHRVVPDLAAMSYTTIVDDDQYVHQMFCGGYDDMIVDTSSYKIGDTALNSTNFDHTLELHQSNNNDFTVYPERRITTAVAGLLEYGVEIVRGTPANTRRIHLFITFPSGLVKYSDKGNPHTRSVQLALRYRIAGGTWSDVITLTYSGGSNKTVRREYIINLDNLTSGGADYSATRQYEVELTRLTADSSDSKIIDKVYFDNMQCVTGVFDTVGGTVNTDPILLDAASVALTLHAIRIKASSTVSGQIDEFNYIAQTNCFYYSGTGTGVDAWTEGASSNPAALFLHVLRSGYLNKKPATNDQINWGSFESWYTFCASKSFEFNNHNKADFSLKELLDAIALTGRATWSIANGKYIVIPDKSQTTIVQMFTPRNSWGFQGSKTFLDQPTALRVKFVNEDLDYEETERLVYYDEVTPSDDLIQDVNLFGVTSSDIAYRHARYQLACIYLRPEIFTFNADIEHLVCTRWDRIAYANDVLLSGLYFGRIKRIFTSLGNVTGLELDERMVFEPGVSYAVTIRLIDGTSTTRSIVNPCIAVNVETDEFTFTTPFAIGSPSVTADDLCIMGVAGEVYTDLIITAIEPDDDYSARITCVPYDEDVYAEGAIPEYDPFISKRGDATSAVVVGIPVDASLIAIDAGNAVSETDVSLTAISAINDTLIKISDGTFSPEYPFYSNLYDKIIYLDNATGDLYYKDIESDAPGSLFIDYSGYVFCEGYYVRDNGYIYDFNGNAVIENECWCPQVDESGVLFYINLDDNCIYKYESGVSTLLLAGAREILWIHYMGDNELLVYDDGTLDTGGVEGLVLISTVDGSYVDTIITGIGEIINFKKFDENYIVYLDDELNLYKVNIATGAELLYIQNVLYYDVSSGSIYFVNKNDSYLYTISPVGVSKISNYPYFRTSSAIITITGDLANESNIISGVSAADMNRVEVDEVLIHAELPTSTYVTSKDLTNNTLILSANASDTVAGATITVSSARVLFDAPAILAPATVTSDELADNSVNLDKIASSVYASLAEALAGTENTKIMTALRMREGLNAAGSAPVYACRAWVNFDGTSAGTFAGGTSTVYRENGSTTATVTTENDHGLITGNYLYAASGVVAGRYMATVTGAKTFTITTAASTLLNNVAITFYVRTINGSGNISCVSYNNSAGDYDVNFAVAMDDANYCVAISCSGATTNRLFGAIKLDSILTAQSFNLITLSEAAGAGSSPPICTVTIFR